MGNQILSENYNILGGSGKPIDTSKYQKAFLEKYGSLFDGSFYGFSNTRDKVLIFGSTGTLMIGDNEDAQIKLLNDPRRELGQLRGMASLEGKFILEEIN